MVRLARAMQLRPVPIDGGRWLDAAVDGTGRVTVVFEAGMGAGRSTWALVAPAVAAHARVVSYDRAGFGASPVDPEPRTLARAAEDLTALVRTLGPGPVVLVGHSYGGLVVRESARREPGPVAAVVLVDPTDEGCDWYFRRTAQVADRIFAALLPLGGRLGVANLVARFLARPLPSAARAGVIAESGTLAGTLAHQREIEHLDADLVRLRDDQPPALDVPLTVISAARRPRTKVGRRRRDCLIGAHRRRAGRALRGRHVRATRSGHLVMFFEPQLVIEEVLRMVAVG